MIFLPISMSAVRPPDRTMPAALALASILFCSACASTTHQAGAQPTMPQPAPSATHYYRCQSGATLSAVYPSTDSAIVSYKGTRHEMRVAISGSGARYVGSRLEWWTKGIGSGATGTLFRHHDSGSSGALLEECEEYRMQRG